jgi:hypothetical protein
VRTCCGNLRPTNSGFKGDLSTVGRTPLLAIITVMTKAGKSWKIKFYFFSFVIVLTKYMHYLEIIGVVLFELEKFKISFGY